VTTKYDGQFNAACTNMSRYEAEQVIAALRTAFPEEAEVPDIELPDLYSDSKNPYRTVPALVQVEVDGVELTLVNWLDYQGWEVRRRVH
ncbi:hypothetical protein, partial [Streptococcus pneumoniae]|uniref:hypothetical protein n=1 Tax=Streptococcus pneumoniae TaxID=1313 RepID=UPI0018B025B7